MEREEGAAFDINEIRQNTFAVARLSRETFEVPDVIDYADIELCSALFAAELVRRSAAESYKPDRLLTFPYPNFRPGFPGKMRDIAVASAADQVVYRTAGGRIVRITDSLLSNCVCSFRLDASLRKDSAWSFKNSRDSYADFINRGIDILQRGRYPLMCQTDVAGYYSSIRADILERMLRDHSCDPSAIRTIVQLVDYWQCIHGLKGLPIGPEGSTVLGNFFLRQVDHAIMQANAVHLRYMDDLLIFSESTPVRDALVGLVDEQLAVLRLERSIPKTLDFYDSEEAIAHLRNGALASLGGLLKSDHRLGPKALHFAFDRLLDDEPDQIDKSKYHFIVKALRNHNDPYGCSLLAHNANLTNIDPKFTADYLFTGFSEKSPKDRIIEGCMAQLAQPPQEHWHGRDLHILRALTRTKTGEGEGGEFLRIANDAARPWPVRNWGWHAYARSAACHDHTLMEAAREEQEPNVRRAIVATLKYSKTGRRRQKVFLRHVARFPECRFTAEWVRAA